MGMFCMLVAGVLFTGCSKGDSGTPSPGSAFTAADFQLTIVSHGQRAGNAYYSFEYAIKNISNRTYDVNSTDDLVIKCSVKDNGGSTYNTAVIIPTLGPGITHTSALATITLPTGAVANSSTFRAVVEKE